MEVPGSCQPCFDKQIKVLESAGSSRPVDLCPLLAYLALNADHQTPPTGRHFLNLAKECATETHGDGGLYRIQQVQGARAVEAAVKIREFLAPEADEQCLVEEAEEVAA